MSRWRWWCDDGWFPFLNAYAFAIDLLTIVFVFLVSYCILLSILNRDISARICSFSPRRVASHRLLSATVDFKLA
jgi:hypothetical protein